MNVSSIPNYRISLVKEGSVSIQITSPNVAIDLVMAILPSDLDREQFWIILLDQKNHPIGTNCVSIGTINASLVHPREVFKPAILASAASIIIAHNHPSGDAEPSKEDMEVTRRLQDAGKILGIPILDHFIVGENVFSFKNHGLI